MNKDRYGCNLDSGGYLDIGIIAGFSKMAPDHIMSLIGKFRAQNSE